MAQRPHHQSASAVLETLGRRIRAVRMEAGLSQEEAAGRAGIDYKRWQRLEAGEVNATVATLVRVADALQTSFWKIAAKG